MPAPKKGKRFGKSASHQRLLLANLAAPSPGKPSHADLTAGVSVDFHVHPRVDGVIGQFLTAVSDGLRANKQPPVWRCRISV